MEKLLKVQISVNASAQKVWDTLVNPTVWWEGVTLTPKIGGIFQEIWNENAQEKVAVGKVVSSVPLSLLEINWKDEDWPNHMTFTFLLSAGGSGRTHVVLTEKGWEMFASDRRSELMSSHRQGWNYHLAELKQVAEG